MNTHAWSGVYRLGRDAREGCAVEGALHVRHSVLHLPTLTPLNTRNTLLYIHIHIYMCVYVYVYSMQRLYRLCGDPRERGALEGSLHVCHPVLHFLTIYCPNTGDTPFLDILPPPSSLGFSLLRKLTEVSVLL